MFAELLREVQGLRRGRWVDLNERLALERLLTSYDGTSVRELRAAVVAVLAHSAEEAKLIDEAFKRLYPGLVPVAALEARNVQALPTAMPAVVAAREGAARWLRLLSYSVGWLVPLTLLLVGAMWLSVSNDPGSLPVPLPQPTASATPDVPAPQAKVTEAPGQRQLWPPPLLAWQLAIAAVVLGLLLTGLTATGPRLREWSNARARRFANLKGPREYGHRPRQRPSPAVERLKGVLERLAGSSRRSQQLDAAETVRLTAERAAVQVVYDKGQATGRILVLRDVGVPMLPWRVRIDSFLADLRAQTVVDVLYFKDDPTLVMRRLGQRPRPLRTWADYCAGLPLLILSDGRFFKLPSLTPNTLRESLEPWPVRVLLHPVENRSAWPPELTFRDTALPGFALSRRGFRALLRWLPTGARGAHERFQTDESPLWPSDVAHLLAMLSFMPNPSSEVAELLRTRLLPDAPASILLTLDPVLRPTPESEAIVADARTKLREWFRVEPAAAERFWQFWRDHVPQPLPNSAAYQRYMRDRAVMLLHLGTSKQEMLLLGELAEAFIDSPLADGWYRELEALRQQQGWFDRLTWRAVRAEGATRVAAARRGVQGRPVWWSFPRLSAALLVVALAALVLPVGAAWTPPPGVPLPPPSATASSDPPEECPVGSTRCEAGCTDLLSDLRNCGGCGSACGSGETCAQGQCKAPTAMPAPSGCANPKMTECAGRCVDLKTDAANCNRCGRDCSKVGGLGRCIDGHCQQCAPGRDNCDDSPNNGCEVNLLTDNNNCGACGTRCAAPVNAITYCSGGSCQTPYCRAGFGDCDSDWSNGCELQLGSDGNCSQCGDRCGSGSRCLDQRCVVRAPTCDALCASARVTCLLRCDGAKGTQLERGAGNGAFAKSSPDEAAMSNPEAPVKAAAPPKDAKPAPKVLVSCTQQCDDALVRCQLSCDRKKR